MARKDPEKQEQCQKEIKKFGWGVRHVQAASMCACVTALLMVRSSMGVAVLAMTDLSRVNESIAVYEWNKSTQGVILSSFFWGYVAMQIPAGILCKKFGGKPILLFALLSNAAICLLVPTLASLGGWKLVCAARVAIGLTQACTYPGTHTLLGRWVPDHERTLLSSIIYGGTQLGTILGMPVSGLLASTALGWPLVFYAMAALMLATAVLWHFLAASAPQDHRLISTAERLYIEESLNSSQQQSKERVVTPWGAILRSRAVWALVVAHIGTAYGFVMFFVDMPTYLEKGLHISLRDSATLSALPYIGMWVGGLLSALLSDKLYTSGTLSAGNCRKLLNSIGAVGLSIGLVGLGFTTPDTKWLAVLFLITALTLYGFYMSGFMINHLDLSPNFAGVLFSLTNFIANIGSISTPIITGAILRNDPTDLSRWRVAFWVTAALGLCTNLVYVLVGSGERQPWDDPHFLHRPAPEEVKTMISQENKEQSATTS